MTLKNIMILRNISTAALAALFGYLGGVLSRPANPVMSVATAELVRAKRYELLDMAGASIASWGRSQGRTVLVFKGKNGDEQAVFGLRYPDGPYMEMHGKDGNSRVLMQVEADDLPVLLMSDPSSRWRVLLGSIHYEGLYPNALEANWGLVFRAPEHAVPAAIGMHYDEQRRLLGSLTVTGSDGKAWSPR